MRKAKVSLPAVALLLLSGSFVQGVERSEEKAPPCPALTEDRGLLSWRIQTLDTVIGFGLRDGIGILSSLHSVGSADGSESDNWAHEYAEVQLPEAVEVNGQQQQLQWKQARVSRSRWAVTYTYLTDSPRLELVSVWEASPLPGPVEHRVALTNRGDQSITFHPPPTIALGIRADRVETVWWVEQGEGSPSDNGTHVEAINGNYAKSLRTGPNITENWRTRKDRDVIPWFCLHNSATSRVLYGGIEFSGFTEIRLRSEPSGTLSVELGLQAREGKTRSRIKPGDTFEFPACFVGAYDGDVDDGANRLHRWIEGHLRPPLRDSFPMLGNNTWCRGVAFDVNEKVARRMVDDCLDLGIELFEVDAGWFKRAGNWNVDTTKFPGGMEEVSEYAHSRGLEFGLWVAWAQGAPRPGQESHVVSPFHPDQKAWFTEDYPPDWKPPRPPWEGAPVCLGSAGAREWCLKLLRGMIKNYKLDVLRQDQICVVEECSRDRHDHLPGDPVDVSRSAARGYYEIYDQLRREYPRLVFEGCNGGGRMVDFGFLKRVHFYQVEDSYRPLATRRAFYDASHPIPPSMLLQWIRSGPPEETVAEFKYRLRSAMLGRCSIQMNTTEWNAEQRKAAKRQFSLYKQELSPLIASANLYHVLPRPDGKHWDGIQYFDPQRGKGALIVFRPETEVKTQRVLLRGLSREMSYELTAEDGSVDEREMSGDVLMGSGLHLTLAEENSSDVILFTEILGE